MFYTKEPERRSKGGRRKKSTWLITTLILVGLVVGGIFGQWLFGFKGGDGEFYSGMLEALDFVGNDLFLGLLKMMIVPLIISSVIVGVASVGDFRKLGRIGGKTFFYYFSTMLIAVVIGLTLVNVIQPGKSVGLQERERAEQEFTENVSVQTKVQEGPKGFGPAILAIVRQMIPTNPVAAAADPKLAALPIIFFSIFFGIVLTTVGRKQGIVVSFFDAIFEVMTKMVHVVIYLAPLGVFALVAWSIARIGLESYAGGMLWYVLTVILGLAIHGFIVLPLILWLFGQTNPFTFMHQMRSALMTAFGTDSSSATLPVTIEAAIDEGGCSKKAAGFVLPLGATINMDGTALFEAVAVVFIAQAYGIQLGIEQNIVIAITAVLTAVGAAGIPSASLVMMPVIIAAINQSMGGGEAIVPIAGIGLILGIDRLLDMSRTTVNVWGDAVGAKIITRTEPDPVEADPRERYI
ncbi:MAG: dicarboxylate/amino acid:cation symporter [Candidatus Kapaibacterium sp.]